MEEDAKRAAQEQEEEKKELDVVENAESIAA